ncbi:hypothetical protein [Flavobacterium sp.]|uniref:hypothetical protein n=1 Tax=Flavobacterium sp. TaxID=239 RepID=UPI002C88D42D|nr:hypothetical protein [Flavobacterium sp.]HSD07642.1 hypothetical protein [Flavobacterium sp.]
MKKKIHDIVGDQINKLNKCIDTLKDSDLKIKTIEIDSSFLAENYIKSKTFSKCEIFKDLYESLPKKEPVLYWFTYDVEKLKSDSLEQVFADARHKTNGRKFSEIPKILRESNGTLYVGKVKDKFHYRFVNHLGHSVNDKTGSLQLAYWYKPEDFGNLKLNYIVFSEEMKTLLGVLEIELAKELKPIVGSHKN